ncbi:MarR family transcriptional regulator [Tsukamurella sp. M9C]|uniref:MarR family winged helix-turn-helix transcriptional regulator n=1 Tax=unclassified Tsukamurella TaxID=2633480 RepID=UPI001CCE701E|nr:MarR family transcriptional regulator [Tsukamurella sp. M9C]MCA0156253.1 MarR family transcriptional regulator [Tsukamurella sp. M9C]
MPGRTPEGDALTALVLPAFELNGEFLAAAAAITGPHALTPAQWQVLGATLDEARPVSEIARRIGLGLTRQSVQRVANDVVDRGWAEWADNPHHRRAKLLAPTDAGRAAVAAMAAEQHAWADHVGAAVGTEDLETLRALIARVVAASRDHRAATAPSD